MSPINLDVSVIEFIDRRNQRKLVANCHEGRWRIFYIDEQGNSWRIGVAMAMHQAIGFCLRVLRHKEAPAFATNDGH